MSLTVQATLLKQLLRKTMIYIMAVGDLIIKTRQPISIFLILIVEEFYKILD
ncbi:Uncharacterised protein [Mycobacterium tuberculosis]|nr:Uncharacterised protein [Mycobacterium tuberculosis]